MLFIDVPELDGTELGVVDPYPPSDFWSVATNIRNLWGLSFIKEFHRFTQSSCSVLAHLAAFALIINSFR
jgi:hypothetical protein